MRVRSSTVAGLATSLVATMTACSLVVGTTGLAGGGDPDGGGSVQQSSGTGTTNPGVNLGDAGPLPVTGEDAGPPGTTTNDASLGNAPAPTIDAGSVGSSPTDAGARADVLQ